MKNSKFQEFENEKLSKTQQKTIHGGDDPIDPNDPSKGTGGNGNN